MCECVGECVCGYVCKLAEEEVDVERLTAQSHPTGSAEIQTSQGSKSMLLSTALSQPSVDI